MDTSAGRSPWLTQNDLGPCDRCYASGGRVFVVDGRSGVECVNCGLRVEPRPGDLALRQWNGEDDTSYWFNLSRWRPRIGEEVLVRLDTGRCILTAPDVALNVRSKILEVRAKYVDHPDYCWIVEEVMALTASQAGYWRRADSVAQITPIAVGEGTVDA